MNPLLRLLAGAARYGRPILVAGLVAGIVFPGLAEAMKPFIAEMVALLLFLAALRVGPRQAVGALGDLGLSAALAIFLQTVLPVAAILVFLSLSLEGAIATGLALMLAAPPVSGSPNLAILSGSDPAPALRQLVIGTALLPLTVLPVFWLVPEFGDPRAVFGAAGRLLALIVTAAGLAFALRAYALRDPSPQVLSAMDGFSAIVMAIVVIGLMSAVGPAIVETPSRFLAVLAAAFAANISLQVVAAQVAGISGAGNRTPSYAIVAGNRNIALFLTVLPAQAVEPLLLFIGCYQIPMYLTPAIFGRYYRKLAAS